MFCPKCGKEAISTASFCEYCGQQLPVVQTAENQIPQPQQAQTGKKENLVTGAVGALFGAALGAASIILLSQLGYVAALSGLILSVCTLKGYELLGGKLSKKGILICLVIMALTPYFADRIDWAIVVMNAWSDYGVTFGEAFVSIPALIEEEAIEASTYYGNLAMIYLFVILGAFSTLRGLFKKKSK